MTYDELIVLALELPGVEDSTSFGTPALKVRGKLLVRWREDDVIVLRVDEIEKQMLLETQPDVFFTTPHYDGYPAVLVRLSAADPAQLRALMEEHWRTVAPKRLIAALDATSQSVLNVESSRSPIEAPDSRDARRPGMRPSPRKERGWGEVAPGRGVAFNDRGGRLTQPLS